MSSRSSILTVIDPNDTNSRAIERAAWLAERLDLDLELFICDYDPTVAPVDALRERLLEADRVLLDEIAESLSARDFDITTDVRWDRPLDEGIIRKAVESSASFVVKDTHYHSALKRTILSNTDWNLIRQCPTPLLLVKDHTMPAVPTILAAVDPMHEHGKPAELDRHLISVAKRLSAAAGGQTHIAHVFDAAPAAAYATTVAAPEAPAALMTPHATIVAAQRKQHKQALKQLGGEVDIGEPHAHFREGGVANSLIEITKELAADLVVMGAVSRSRLQSAFIGHTAERVLDRLPCDVMVVKPDDFKTRVAGT
jgi:universal stress protein E